MRKQTGLQAIERYRLMQWIEEHHDKVLSTSDRQTASEISEDLDIPRLTHSHVAGARRALGILKPHVVPNPPAVMLEGAFMQDVLTRLGLLEQRLDRFEDLCGVRRNP